MIDELNFQLKNLTEKYEALKQSFNNNNLENIVSKFKDYLYEVFPLREKNLKTNREQVKEFKALKILYNLFKHNCDMGKLLDTHKLISNKSYSYSYPYRYGKSGLCFADFTDVFNSAVYKDLNKKTKDLAICNGVLKDKEVINIVHSLQEDTIKIIKENH